MQHEYGIFGGNDGVYILSLINKLKKPLVAIFHTVLNKPSFSQKAIARIISEKASAVVIMSKLAKKFLTKIYKVDEKKIKIINHGAPNFHLSKDNSLKKKLKLEKKTIILTFGLIGRNKGIETVIHAFPKIIKKHPEAVYIILGKTHPGIIKVSGEEYRNYLKQLVNEYHLENNVFFHDKYINEKELEEYLSSTEIYITPYLNKAQITSGTLSYAISAGTAIISTPYWHALELLDKGRGIIFDFNDSKKLSEIVIDLLDNKNKLIKLRHKAYKYGKTIIWDKAGEKYKKLLQEIVKSYNTNISSDKDTRPLFSLKHIYTLTDRTGILQHCKYIIPNLKEGYCLDDNARALLMTCMAFKKHKDENILKLIYTYISFIYYMQNDDGTFNNFLNYNRQFKNNNFDEDAFGRTIWALGYIIKNPPDHNTFLMALDIFNKSSDNFLKLKSIRAISYTLIGICYYLKHFLINKKINTIFNILTYKLTDSFEEHSDNKWSWFEDIITYDNGVIPLSLFRSYEIIRQKKILLIAKKSTDFLTKTLFTGNHFSFIGNSAWYKKGGNKSAFAQQPIEAMSMVLLYDKAYKITQDKKYQKYMIKSYNWFLGENDLCIPLYDEETGSCYDGLESFGLNQNQGAESTLAYLIANLTVTNAYEKEI